MEKWQSGYKRDVSIVCLCFKCLNALDYTDKLLRIFSAHQES